MAQRNKGVTVTRRLWVRFPLGEGIINYLYFYFFALVLKQKRGVDFRRLTRNTLKNRRKVGKGVLRATLGSLCLPCNMRDTA